MRWRFLYLDENGGVRIEQFGYAEKNEPFVRTNLINRATLHSTQLGYYSDVLHYWPALWFPLLYPFFTGSAGFTCLLAGVVRWNRIRKRSST